ncbi:helix-turn-helix transcriptional regulator [Actinoplanes sp. NBRC 103695]|uniref:helix-turn-helix domain-containing protein n=1 Tax=Actinoplanes sp. NBRC 103695 TaxID=3032202 RepID=UPI0025526ECE|nr:helix-turn-helix transcriptional regulator [Actinoplanes sp. NBRC 103695]
MAVASTVPRRILGIALRRFRTRAGKTMREAADVIGQSEQSVRRIEQGTVSTPTGKVANLCELYAVPAQTRQALLGLAKETKSTAACWWHSYADVVPAWFELYVALEATACRLRCFDPLLVNGLLQGDAYMAEAIRAIEPELSEEDVDARAELRRSRQRLLARFPDPLRLEVIIAEAVLLAELPEGVMRAQLWHLLQASELPHVQVRVLPLSAGLHQAAVAGPFTMLDFPAEDGGVAASTVYGESLTGAIYLDASSEIAAYDGVWAALAAASLSKTESIELISRRMKELNDRESGPDRG